MRRDKAVDVEGRRIGRHLGDAVFDAAGNPGSEREHAEDENARRDQHELTGKVVTNPRWLQARILGRNIRDKRTQQPTNALL